MILAFYINKILTRINTGISSSIDQPKKPKKLGMEILFSSAIDFTIKFGALPI
jgi:hypothetical protein